MKIILIGSIVLVVIILMLNGQTVRSDDELAMKNTAAPAENLITGGQPTAADLAKLKARGVTTVISLRKLTESNGFDQAGELEKLGMTYIQIPISGAGDLTKENAKKLDEALNNIEGSALVHCASSNRVGALLALREFHFKGKSAEDAMALGKSAGMKSLTKAVAAKVK